MQLGWFSIFAIAVGLCIGSFANVVIHRFFVGKSVVTPSSHCVNCETSLKWRDMIPVVSWIILKGRCRFCNVPISKSYPLIEVACALLFLIIATYRGICLSTVPLWGLSFVLLTVSEIDRRTLRIPDGLLLVGVLFGLMWVGLPCNGVNRIDALLGMIAGGLPLFLIDRLVWLTAKKPGFGLGDSKLMAMSGLFLGWQYVHVAFFVAFVTGGLWSTWLLATKKAQRGSYIPFGPFLCLGILVALLYLFNFSAAPCAKLIIFR